MAFFLTKNPKKKKQTNGKYRFTISFFHCSILNFRGVKGIFLGAAAFFFVFLFHLHDFEHFSPLSPSLIFTSSLFFSSLLLSVVFRCLCFGRFFFALCCCRLFLLCFVLSLLLLLLCCCWLLLVAVDARAAAAGAAGGSCVLLSSCFSFRDDFSLFLLIFSVVRAIAE